MHIYEAAEAVEKLLAGKWVLMENPPVRTMCDEEDAAREELWR